MSRVRLVLVALVATIGAAACSTPTAPAANPALSAPSFDEGAGTPPDTTARSGYQVGHG